MYIFSKRNWDAVTGSAGQLVQQVSSSLQVAAHYTPNYGDETVTGLS